MGQQIKIIFIFGIVPFAIMFFTVWTPFIPSWYLFQTITSVCCIAVFLFFSIRFIFRNFQKIKNSTLFILLCVFSTINIAESTIKLYWGQDNSFLHATRELKKEYSSAEYNTTIYVYHEPDVLSGKIEIRVKHGSLPLMYRIIRLSPGFLDSLVVRQDTVRMYVYDNGEPRSKLLLRYALSSGKYCITGIPSNPLDPREDSTTYRKYNHWEFSN